MKNVGSSIAALILVTAAPLGATAGDTAYPSHVELACWASLDDCTSDFRLDVGSSSMVYSAGGTHSVTGDSYHDGGGGDCADEYDAGDITSGESLVLHIGNAHITDLHSSNSTTARKRLYVEEYSSSDCSGSYVRYWADAQIITTASGAEGIECRADGYMDCSGGYSDPTSACRLADVVISKPGTGVYSYEYKVYAGMYSCTSSGCTYESEDTGCISVDWK